MTPHVSPGQDCTINPIVIDDSKRSAKKPSCFGHYERDPCIRPWCPVKVECREHMEPMTPSPQLIREEIVEIIKESVSSGRIFEMQKLLSRPSPAPTGCHWYKEDHCTKEEWLDEWERRGGPKQTTLNDGITKTSPLPKIIPPLPKGDTSFLKTWQDYWKQHDAAIVAATRKDFIEKAQHLADTIPNFNRMDYMHLLKESLRHPSAPEQEDRR